MGTFAGVDAVKGTLTMRCAGGMRVMAALLCFAAGARGDTLVTKDGKTFEGRVISRGSSIVFEAHKYGSKITVTIPKTNVASLTEGPITAATHKVPVRPKKRILGNLPPEPEAPPVAAYSGPTYYLIPLNGMVGRTFSADVLARSLADAAKRKPSAVVLHVDSPGGLMNEVEPLVRTIARYKRDLRIAVLVKRAISAAAITSLAANAIYVEPGSVIGAATAFRLTPAGTPAAVTEKIQSLWRAKARSFAAMGGHSPLLANAMIDASAQLYVIDRGGKKVILERPVRGCSVVTRSGRLLTMTAGEALACGLAAGQAADPGELGTLLGHAGWTECRGLARPLAEYRDKAIRTLTEDMTKLKKQYDANMTGAMDSAPWKGRYEYYSDTRKFTRASWRRWNERSRKCVVFLTQAKGDLAKAAAIAEKFPKVFGDPKWFRAQEDRIKAARTKIAEESRKSSPF